MIPVYVIHLQRAVSRRAHAEMLCRRFGTRSEIVPAVDGTTMPKRGFWAKFWPFQFPPYPFGLRRAEIATFLSHRACWQRLVDDGHAAALILEDDVELGDGFDRALALVQGHHTDNSFSRLPVKLREESGSILASDGDTSLSRPHMVGLGMQAQFVTQGAARQLLAASASFDRPVDAFLQMTWLHKVDVLTVWPSDVTETSGTLGGSTIHRPMSKPERLYRNLVRPIYRYAVKVKSLRARHDP